jgi:hypothetical protein
MNENNGEKKYEKKAFGNYFSGGVSVWLNSVR